MAASPRQLDVSSGFANVKFKAFVELLSRFIVSEYSEPNGYSECIGAGLKTFQKHGTNAFAMCIG